jgi:hypothetical protein
LGTNTLVLLATRKTTARIPATIHRYGGCSSL